MRSSLPRQLKASNSTFIHFYHNNATVTEANVIKYQVSNTGLSQEEFAAQFKTSQSSLSRNINNYNELFYTSLLYSINYNLYTIKALLQWDTIKKDVNTEILVYKMVCQELRQYFSRVIKKEILTINDVSLYIISIIGRLEEKSTLKIKPADSIVRKIGLYLNNTTESGGYK